MAHDPFAPLWRALTAAAAAPRQPALPTLPQPRPCPISEAETAIIQVCHPDEALILTATHAIRIARAALLTLAERGSDDAMEMTAERIAERCVEDVIDIRFDAQLWADGASERAFVAGSDAAYEARRDDEMMQRDVPDVWDFSDPRDARS